MQEEKETYQFVFCLAWDLLNKRAAKTAGAGPLHSMSYSTMVGYKKGRLEMKALRKLGKGAESVQLCEVEKPIPGPNDLLVKVMAAGDRKSTRLNSSHRSLSRMPSSA